MEKYINNFVNFLEKDKKLSDNTLQSYRRDIEQFSHYLANNNIEETIEIDKFYFED